jgi:glutaminase
LPKIFYCKQNFILIFIIFSPEEVHQKVGCESSGKSYNDLVLNDKNLPHNLLINASVIMICALLTKGKSYAEVR